MSNTSREKIYGVDESERNARLLRIKVLQATDLQRRDSFDGSGDPYIQILLQSRENQNQTIDTARTRTVSKTLNPLWNQDFIFRVDSTKHRLIFKIYCQNPCSKDEFLGMFFVKFNINIPYESAEQAMLTKDYPLFKQSVPQHVFGTATIELCYVNPTTFSTRTGSIENGGIQRNDSGLETIQHDNTTESIAAATQTPLPPGWEDASGRTYYVDHNTRTTTWNRPNERNAAAPERPQPQIGDGHQSGDRHQIDDGETNNAKAKPSASPAAASHDATDSASSNNLGPLPLGWQMFKTENDRICFIDHINKKTTWIDPRTGKSSASPSVQHELNQNGSLPEHWEARTLPDGRIYYIDHFNKKTTWTHPRIAEP
ncbi:unnamed protein product, partial [Rotaria magnacalcarata]